MRIDREARRLAGYRYGRQIADDYMRLLGQGDSQVLRWLEAEKDPRLTEIVTHLNQVVEGRVSDERDGGVQSAEP
ncbi:hypothetical protein LRM35_17800 [Klebsiella variicola subsp. variicola]|nr:hypothetical protein LRM35_17800 [Klebsiella variicola subsp. variicola]